MNPVNSNILIGKKDAAFFAANPTLVLLDGQLLYNENTGELFIGDGVTQLNALSPINSGFTPSGTNTQYIAGDGSYINFPTDVSYFNNDAGYLDSGDIGVSVQPYDSNTTLLGNSTTGSGDIVLANSPTFVTDITTPQINGVSSLVAFGSNTIHTTTGNICVGRSNPDRPIEVYSSTGNATMQAYTTNASSVAGVYSQANNASNYISIVQAGTTWTTNGLRQKDSSWIEAAGEILSIYNYNPVGDVVIATGGFATANEKLRFSPTVTTFKGNTINFDNGTGNRILATDASKNVQFLDTATYPSLTELAFVKGVTSAIQTQLNLQTFTTTHFHGLLTVGTTTYHYDKYPSSTGVAAGSGVVGSTVIPFNCTLIGFSLSIAVLGVLGTGNNATVSVRVNNTTDITLTSSALFSSATSRYSSSSINTNLNAGDYVEIKVIPNCTPTSATNVTESVTLYFRRR